MAAFNPQTADTGVIDQTSASRGTGPNRTFETLFSGLTQTAENVINIKDTQTQLDIQEDARTMFENTNKEFGFDPDLTPEGVQDGVDQIQTLQNALAQGKISEVNYYGRLATLSKQLRSKYPGYESIVDSTIQSVTGTRPANAYRDAILAEFGKMASEASDAEKRKQSWIEKNAGDISIAVGDAFFDNPDAYDFDKVQAAVAKFQGRRAQVDYSIKDLNLMKSQGEFNDKRAARTMDQDFSLIVESTLTKVTGANSPSYQDSLNQFIARGGGTPEELDQFIATVSEAEAQLRAQLTARGRQVYTAQGLASSDDVNKAVEAALYPILAAKEAVLGGNFQLAERYATINKAISDRDLNELYKDPNVRAGQGLTKINQSLGDEFLKRKNINGELDTIALDIVGRTMSGEKGAVQATIESGNQKLARSMVNQTYDALVNPKTQGDDFSHLIDERFGTGAFDFMGTNVKAEDREQIYMKFLSPEMTKAVFSKGSPEDQQKYLNWALDKFKSIPAFKAAAGDINTSLSGKGGTGLQLQFDENQNRFFMTVPSGTGDPQAQAGGRVQVYSRAVNALNKSLAVLDPILDGANVDKKSVLSNLMKDLSIEVDGNSPELTPGKNKTFWGSVYDALTKPIGELGSETSGTPVDTMSTQSISQVQVPETPEIDPGEIDFLFESPKTVGATQPVMDAASGGITGDLSDFHNLKNPIDIAEKFDGLHERRDKDVISSFIKKAGGQDIDPSTTAWCAAFVNAVLGASGSKGTGRLNARSFLDWGTPVRNPTKGDVVILERGGADSWKGHVGFVVSVNKDTVTILGGNQGNSVSQKDFPKSKVLGYRRPVAE